MICPRENLEDLEDLLDRAEGADPDLLLHTQTCALCKKELLWLRTERDLLRRRREQSLVPSHLYGGVAMRILAAEAAKASGWRRFFTEGRKLLSGRFAVLTLATVCAAGMCFLPGAPGSAWLAGFGFGFGSAPSIATTVVPEQHPEQQPQAHSSKEAERPMVTPVSLPCSQGMRPSRSRRWLAGETSPRELLWVESPSYLGATVAGRQGHWRSTSCIP